MSEVVSKTWYKMMEQSNYYPITSRYHFTDSYTKDVETVLEPLLIGVNRKFHFNLLIRSNI